MKHSFSLIFCLLSLLVVSCDDEFKNSKKLKMLNFDDFSITVPANWDSFSSAGYDSKVGGITNGRDTLTYDFGWYSYNFKNQTTETHIRTETVIDGYDALIVRPKQTGEGMIGVFIQVDHINKLSLYGRSKNEATILNMFESIKFSDKP